MKKIKVAVLGATGLVGQTLVSLLENHPWFELTTLCASSKNIGLPFGKAIAEKKIGLGRISEEYSNLILKPCQPDIDAQLVFSALDSSVAGEAELSFARAGYHVISNAKNHRMSPTIPLVIPEINADQLAWIEDQAEYSGSIVTNSNCATVGLCLALAPLIPFGIKHVTVTTMQALSGAGLSGISAVQALGNCNPHIPGEEEKLENEPLKIFSLGTQLPEFTINASCNRVPILHGHQLAITVQLENYPQADEWKNEVNKFKPLSELHLPTAPDQPIIMIDSPFRPQPLLDVNNGNGMSVSVGPMKLKNKDYVQFNALVHNLIRGAAGAAILNGELFTKAYLMREDDYLSKSIRTKLMPSGSTSL